MQATSPFTIYNASAGSGKTYTLVKEYIKLLLVSNNHEAFKSILAITFTNKAVGEMKSRIIKTLTQFADSEILKNPNDIFIDICKELNVAPKVIQKKSHTILQAILHNYSAFDISTIDGFTHKLIRTFAKDLQLSQNFEVELDTESIINEAVDALVAKTGDDILLTDTLIEFALEKVDDDKSWDVTYDLNLIAKRLTFENDKTPLSTLKDKSLENFKSFKEHLITTCKTIKSEVVERAVAVLKLIDENGIELNDFSRGYIPKHFTNLSKGKFDINFEAKWQLVIEDKPLYPSRVSGSVALTIDKIQPEIVESYHETKKWVYQYNFYQAILKNINPLSLLNLINRELKKIKDEENKVLISEFNSIISKEIKNQPTPFIYERLGEKFKHYFIDEFQDTSIAQWENLKPLISNSIEQEQNENRGGLMLVGDAKQAIYRWRGGKAEQFIELYNKKMKPFQVDQEIKNLNYNYRSHQEIVNFNNGLFSFLASEAFSNPEYQDLYERAKQNPVKNDKGYVSLQFLDLENEEDSTLAYCEETIKTIKECLSKGFSLEDICVLVRKNEQAIAVANHLTENNIPIISSETLLLKSSETILFLNAVLTLLIQPKNEEAKATFLYYLAKKYCDFSTHDFLYKHFLLDTQKLFKELENIAIYLPVNALLNLPLYECVEALVRIFDLNKTADAYLQFYLDIVLEYSHKQVSDIKSFLEYFENKKDSLSVVSTENQDAVKIMTIHKSKGLEFPVVVFPFAALDIYKEMQAKEWFPINGVFDDFNYALVNHNKDLATFGKIGELLYNSRRAQQELDAINLLYVAFTRPVEQLYVISKLDIKNNIPNKKTYAGLLISYLMENGIWNESQSNYNFGIKERIISKEEIIKKTIHAPKFISVDKSAHNISIITKSGLLWDTSQAEAIEKGNIIHDILAKIKTLNDVDFAIQDSVSLGQISEAQSVSLKTDIVEIISHKNLKSFFTQERKVFNEKDIITKEGDILRPDRLVFMSDYEVVLIDYKTGNEKKSHEIQLDNYSKVLKDMNLTVLKKILVYINSEIKVKEL